MNSRKSTGQFSDKLMLVLGGLKWTEFVLRRLGLAISIRFLACQPSQPRSGFSGVAYFTPAARSGAVRHSDEARRCLVQRKR